MKGAIEELSRGRWTPGLYSRMFLVHKKSGVWRPIIDLSTFNKYVVSPHFQMEPLWHSRGGVRDVGDVHQLEGHVFPHSYPEVSQVGRPVHLGWKGVPFSCHALRPYHGSLGLYQAASGRGIYFDYTLLLHMDRSVLV